MLSGVVSIFFGRFLCVHKLSFIKLAGEFFAYNLGMFIRQGQTKRRKNMIYRKNKKNYRIGYFGMFLQPVDIS